VILAHLARALSTGNVSFMILERAAIGDEITAGELRRKLKANFKNMPSICDWGCGVTDSGCDEGLRKLRGGD
jgi:hypothetical protein